MLARTFRALGLVALICASAPALAAAQSEQPRVTIAMLPQGTTVEQIKSAVPTIAPGVLSAGLGRVPASQTYLDIGQGSRLSDSLYDDNLPPLYVTGNRVAGFRWDEAVARAEEAPADIVPGLLASTLNQSGVPIMAAPLAGSPALIAVDRQGRVQRAIDCEPNDCPGVDIVSVGLSDLPGLEAELRPTAGDLLIALERPPPDRDLLALGIAGGGFSAAGNLTSPTTRMDGYVASTDLLPTILDVYGIAEPGGVTGRVIETDGDSDAAAVASREARLGEISDRRWGVLAVNLLIWISLVLIAWRVRGRSGLQLGLTLLAITMAFVPALLLVTAALAPAAIVERLIIGLCTPLVAAATLRGARRIGPPGERATFAAFAFAAFASILATSIDVVAGSPFTPLSLLGPNPSFGVRFFGIGNELEATIGVLLMLGAGAAVTAAAPGNPRRTVAILATAVTIAAVLVFAPGRFGADVGAAITFPAGAAGVVIAALGLGGRRAVLVVLAPVAALLALIAIDLVLGGDAHLSRSVLAAGGLDEIGDVLERRIILGAKSFPRYIDSPFFITALVAIAMAVWKRDTIASWFASSPAAWAGVIGAAAATVVGTLANDSAALLLMVGTGFIAAFCGLAWGAVAPQTARSSR